MKISYKNTALSFLDDPFNFPMHTPGEGYSTTLDKAGDLRLLRGLQAQFAEPEFVKPFKKNIQYITQPFYDAYRKAEPKLKEVVQSTEFDDSGTLLLRWQHHTQTIFYHIQSNGNKENWQYAVMIVLFTKAKINDSYGLDAFIYLSKEEEGGKGGDVADYVWTGFTKEGRDMAWWISDLLLFKTFLKYAEVETKIIAGNRKDKHIGVKYVNETKNKIEILDSTYFTTISRTEGFGVRGHFRFQPYGPGMKLRRLQWIDSFEKSGYTKQAKIERGD